MFLWRQIQLSLEFSNVIEEWGIKFCPTASFASASQLKKQTKVCEVHVVRSCTYFLVPVLHAGYVRYYTALSQFVEDRVRLLECSPLSCLAPRYHCEEKKFITRQTNNKLSSHFSFDMQAYFFICVNKKCFSRRKKSLFERNTILSRLPGTPNSKYFDDLT